MHGTVRARGRAKRVHVEDLSKPGLVRCPPFVEQFVDRPDTRRRRAHLGGCPTHSRQLRSASAQGRRGRLAVVRTLTEKGGAMALSHA
jgi:hypothetical protein